MLLTRKRCILRKNYKRDLLCKKYHRIKKKSKLVARTSGVEVLVGKRVTTPQFDATGDVRKLL